MIVCPNCNHPNPDGAVQCEACYTPLPATISCPSCGATVQADASFCGQCGFNLRSAAAPPTVAPDIPVEIPPTIASEPVSPAAPVVAAAPIAPPEVPPTVVATAPAPIAAPEIPAPDPIVPPPTIVPSAPTPPPAPPIAAEAVAALEPAPVPEPVAEVAAPAPVPEPVAEVEAPAPVPEPVAEVEAPAPVPEPVAEVEAPAPPPPPATPIPVSQGTQLQQFTACLIHIQSDQQIELPQNLSVIHMGKPNDRVPPDIDVSGFSNSEIVSRIHADIRVEGDAYYIEDVGSSNGTYINNLPLLPGNRHRLRPGDRIGLGKGDLVTFLFQMS